MHGAARKAAHTRSPCIATDARAIADANANSDADGCGPERARGACEARLRPVDRHVEKRMSRNRPAFGPAWIAALRDAKHCAMGLVDAGNANDEIVAPEGGLPVHGEDVGKPGHALMVPRARLGGY
ncbi:hypothetical protein WS72_22485 [Burkholderia savannae]|uniref:Uncharacterized protein n=1 Tax=Burkholderia savannae TaxID=1637837 RepID=A0ABR5T3B2_9BURK|nr:hypothetical protein WS72_22485 [Burkholderia savannae]